MSRLLWTIANTLSADYRRFSRYVAGLARLTPGEAAAESRRRLHRYLNYCRTYSPFWRERWPAGAAEFSPDEAPHVLNELPTLKKADLREHIDRLRVRRDDRKPNDGYPPTRGQSSMSSGGSTGQPTTIWVDRGYGARLRCTYDTFYRAGGLRPGEPFFFVWGSANELRDVKVSFRKKVSSWLRGMHPMPAYRLTPDKIRSIRDEMARHPGVKSAICFVTALETIVEYAEHSGLEFPRLKRVFTGGGLLHPRLRELVKKHLADDAFDLYAGRDIGMLAAETPGHDGLSVAGWLNTVEVLGPDGRRVADGGRGEIHVTQMHNFACALIRMASGDEARWLAGPGNNPFPTDRLADLAGRSLDRLRLPNDTAVDDIAVIHLIGVVIRPPWLKKFQLAHVGPTQFELRVETWDATTELEPAKAAELESRVQAELSNLADQAVQVRVVRVAEIPPRPSGKHQYIVREFGPDRPAPPAATT